MKRPGLGQKLITLLLSATALGASGFAATAQDKPPFPVGLLLPMQVPSGYESMVGAEMAVSEINAAGGILGRQVKLIPGDDQSNPTAAVSEARRLIEIEKVQAILGTVVSQNVLAISPLLVRGKILEFGVAGAAAVTPKSAPNMFSSYFNSQAQAQAMFRYATEDLKAKSIAIFAESGTQARGGVEEIKKLAEANNIKVTGDQQFDTRAPDFTPQLLALRRGNPDVLLFWLIQQEDDVTLLKNLEDIGWTIPISASGVGATGATYVKQAMGPGHMKNIHGTLLRLNTYCPGEPLGSSPWTAFIERIKKFKPVDGAKLNPGNVIMIYNATYVMKAGMDGAGTVDADAVKKYLETHKVTIPTGVGAANGDAHFMISGDDIVTVSDPDEPRDDGLVRRARC